MGLLSDLTIQMIAFRVLALLIFSGVHGGAIAGTAVLLGDKGPKYDGRLTVVPFGHMHLVGSISLILFGLGWTKPIEIGPQEFRTGRMGIVAVILAGFVGLLVTAALLDALVPRALTTLSDTAALTTAAFLRTASSLAIWFALFSLVPIPPLTGGLLLKAFGIRVPQSAQWGLVALLLVAVSSGAVRQLLGPAHALLATLILGR